MNLDYKILWFEDIESSFNAKKRLVKRVVENLGFIFPEPRNEVNADNLDAIDFQIYDLMIADLNLANGEKGSTILNTIRDKGIYTEVIFYSSEGEDYVRKELSKFQIDGVYCADRANEDFIDKVEKVIHTTIKKVQDLNNMRGLIMAETSDIDETMLSIIQTIIDKNSYGIKDSLIENIFSNVKSKLIGKKDEFEKFQKKGNIAKVIESTYMFDAFEKIKAVQFIIDSFEHEITAPYKKDGFKNSYSEITRTRNKLGHEKQKRDKGKIIIGTGKDAFEFTDNFCVQIRKKVQTHGDYLNELYKSLI